MIQTIRLFIANGLAGFMDFGIGTCIACTIAFLHGVTLPWYLIIVGGLLALVPDFDLIPTVFKGVSPNFDHRQTIFHRPLVVLPVTIFIAFTVGGEMWAMIAGLCVFSHFIHDTNFITTDYGIAWLWPFSKQYWSIFGPFSPAHRVASSHHHWLEQNWLKPSLLSIREVSVGLFGLSFALWLSAFSIIEIMSICLVPVLVISTLWLRRIS